MKSELNVYFLLLIMSICGYFYSLYENNIDWVIWFSFLSGVLLTRWYDTSKKQSEIK